MKVAKIKNQPFSNTICQMDQSKACKDTSKEQKKINIHFVILILFFTKIKIREMLLLNKSNTLRGAEVYA